MSIRFSSAAFAYRESNPVLTDLDLEIPQGDFLLVTGRNGAGKSTFLRLLNGMLIPTKGTVSVHGKDTRHQSIAALSSEVAVTFQHPSDQIFASTVLKETLFGPANLRRTNPLHEARSALALFGLEGHESRHPYDLSPAARRLLTIASAVAMGSSVLAFDEPTVHLSAPERVVLREAIASLRRNRRTIIVVSHDLEFFLPIAGRIMLLDAGRIAHLGTMDSIPEYVTRARSAGIRLPLSFRLRPYAGLPLVPEPRDRTSNESYPKDHLT